MVVDPHSGASWDEATNGVGAVVHLIALTHAAAEAHRNDAAAFTETNVGITTRLLDAVESSRVTRFVYMSSIKAAGEESEPGRPLSETDPLMPEDHYGRSKAAAEDLVIRRAEAGSFSYTILRPPMVYGRTGVGNMQRLASLVRRGIPLPLGSVDNQRSIIYVGNLTDAVLSVLRSQNATNQVFHVADPYSLSTPSIVRAIANGIGREVRLFSLPTPLLGFAGWATRRSAEVRKLTRSLEVSTNHIKDTIGWTAPIASQTGIAETVR